MEKEKLLIWRSLWLSFLISFFFQISPQQQQQQRQKIMHLRFAVINSRMETEPCSPALPRCCCCCTLHIRGYEMRPQPGSHAPVLPTCSPPPDLTAPLPPNSELGVTLKYPAVKLLNSQTALRVYPWWFYEKKNNKVPAQSFASLLLKRLSWEASFCFP